MNKISLITTLLAVLAGGPKLHAQELQLKNEAFDIRFSKNGTIASMVSHGKNIEFRKDRYFEGPATLLSDSSIVLQNVASTPGSLKFSGETPKVSVSLSYSLVKKALAIRVELRNKTSEELPVNNFMLRMGINTEMDSFPHWQKVFFPTMMRSEKDFFWGYLMNPSGEIVVVASEDPVASWSHSYKNGGHRIFTTNLNLMHRLPLPERHPQNLYSLKPNEGKKWTIYLQPTDKLQEVKPIVSQLSHAVIVDSPQYTIAENESFRISLIGRAKNLQLTTPAGKQIKLKPSSSITITPTDGVGKYVLRAVSTSGKATEAVLSVRKPWSWYMLRARENALVQEQKGGSHAESWYGLFSIFLAQKYFPNEELLKKSFDKFNEIYPLMYDDQGNPKSKILWNSWDITNRIQNTATMASLLADMYSIFKDTAYLAKASRMCDFLSKNQDKSGAFRNGNTHYTSVIYIAKSILEVSEQEKQLANNGNIWQQRYDRHFKSAKLAIDELTENRDNIETEGEMTYEDGMISCSYTQIALLATLIPDAKEREKYIQSAEYLRKGHQSLSQLLIPDSRMNGGSLRYWESQYDILSFSNMMSSPHGWSAWRIYGLYYLYQLTGNTELLDQMYNALGSGVQLVDEKTGILRWAFCVDPYLLGDPYLNNPNRKFGHDAMKNGNLLVKDTTVTSRENRGIRINKPVGEQYMSMISGWYKAKPNTWVSGYWEPDGGSCDNDVHEMFKCLEETALTNAFVTSNRDGALKSYNCRIEENSRFTEIFPNEDIVRRVHFNIKKDTKVRIHFKDKTVDATIKGGEMVWVSSEL